MSVNWRRLLITALSALLSLMFLTCPIVGLELSLSKMSFTSFATIIAAVGGVRAARYSLNAGLVSSKQPFSDAFVSYSIEFSSFPDFAGKRSQALRYTSASHEATVSLRAERANYIMQQGIIPFQTHSRIISSIT